MRKQTLIIPGPWEFREFPETARRMSDLEEGHWLKTDQPQSIFLSLAGANILTLDDLYAQPRAFQWVARQAWVFRTQFTLPREFPAAGHLEMVFEGLDTVTQIWLNDKLLGRTDNMFMTYRFDVGTFLVPQENTLVIQFLPAREHAGKLMYRYGKAGSPVDQSACAYLRKAQYQFGSAMGPELINCGIIKPVRLESTRIADIKDVHLRSIDCNESAADIRAAITLRTMDTGSHNNLRCILQIHGQGSILSSTLDFKDRQNRLSTVLRIERPALWQPKGYGRPFRYRILVRLYSDDNLLDEKELFFGLRTVRVLRPQEEDSIPLTLEVNQQTIQAHGVYWVPAGLFPAPDELENKKRLLHKLAEANVNLLCIWGGGSYEDDVFYDLCDQLGIMVWQELMFTPEQVSDRLWLINEFRREMEQVLCRLRNHACIVGWCCNRPDESSAHTPEKRKRSQPGGLICKDIAELLNEGDPDRDCIAAFSTAQSRQDHSGGFHSGNWLNVPQTHPSDQNDMPWCALPRRQTLQIACREEELFAGSAQLESHFYCSTAFAGMAGRTESLFAPPKTLDQQIYQTQVAQGRWVKKRIESIRTGCIPNPLVMPWTAGQFWPCAGFSMLDFTQTPNAMYYYAKRAFDPVIVCLAEKNESRPDGSNVSLPAAIIVNDRPESLMGRIVFELLDMKGQILDTGEFPVFIGSYSRSPNIMLSRSFLNPVFPEKNILHLAVWDSEKQVCENTYLFMPDKHVSYKPLEIDLTIRPVSEHNIILELRSRYFVKDLELAPPQNAELNTNFFDLLPGRNYEITAHFNEPLLRIDAPWQLRSACTL